MTNTGPAIGTLSTTKPSTFRDLLHAAKNTGESITIYTVIDPDGISCTITEVGPGSDPVITASRTVGGRTATFWIPFNQIVYVNQLNADAATN